MEPLAIESPTAEATAPMSELSGAALSESLTKHCETRGYETVRANYELLESLPGQEDEATARPALTLCVPVAINHSFKRTIDIISDAQKHFGKPVDLIVWANAKYTTEADATATADTARQRYDALREQLTALDSSGLRVRTALQVLPEQDATMSKLRANYMDAVAMDAQQRKLGYEHPVMWLDADTINLSKHTLAEVEGGVRNFDKLFLHPVTRYSLDWTDGGMLETQDAATKMVAINEIQRRQVARNERNRPIRTIYPEESGLAFAIGTYLTVGGVDTSDPINESQRLVGEASVQELDLCDRYREVHGKDTEIPPSLSILPAFITRHRTERLDTFGYLKNVAITMSARRQYVKAKRGGIRNLNDEDMSGGLSGDYKLYTDMAQKAPDSAPDDQVQAEQILQFVARPEMAQRTTPLQMRTAEELVRRYFDDAS